jgi:hypothetical protein
MRIVARYAFYAASIIIATHSAANAATITLFTDEAAFDAAVVETLIDDFESVVPKDVNLPGLVSNGIIYTPLAGSPFPNVNVTSPGATNYGAGVGTTTTSILTTSGDEDILASIGATFAVGFDVYLNGLGPASATFFNGADVLGVINFPSDASDQRFAGVLSDVPVTSFRWTSTLGAQLNTGIDNVTFGRLETTAVPEPATLLLLGSGLAAAARRRYRGTSVRS